MAFNFCNPSYKPHIHCDKVSTDGYEVVNLISGNSFGYLAERFIKPPVNIVVEFPCNIEIHHININPIVGSQKSSSIEILSQTSSCSNFWLDSMEDEKTVATTEGVFYPVGRGNSNDGKIFCFLNKCFQTRHSFHSLQIPCFPKNSVICDLRHHKFNTLSTISHIMIRITRTLNCSVPAIGSVEIWGQPARTCSRNIVSKIMQIKNNLNTIATRELDMKKDVDGDSIKVRHDDKDLEPASLVVAGHTIPSEFLDPITYEVMSLPVLLPSGHSIDQSTLDKHTSAESSWGRAPSDPFTGVVFDTNNKPLPNSVLKARIDKFLFDSNIDVTDIPRTLGLKQYGEHPSHNPEKIFRTGIKHISYSLAGESKNFEGRQNENLRKKFKTETELLGISTPVKVNNVSEEIKQFKVETGQTIKSTSKETDSNVNIIGNKFSGTKTQTAHKQRLDSSLNIAISNTLSSYPTFRKTATEMKGFNTEKQSVLCSDCSKQGEMLSMYKLTCGHIICRQCALAEQSEKCCNACGCMWRSKDITRIH